MRSKGTELTKSIYNLVFYNVIQHLAKFSVEEVTEMGLSPSQQKRLYIAKMNTFRTKKEIAQHMDPKHFEMKLNSIEDLRELLVYFVQSRNKLFSRTLLPKVMEDIIKHHSQNVNDELFFAAVMADDLPLAASLGERIMKEKDFMFEDYVKWLWNMQIDVLETLVVSEKEDGQIKALELNSEEQRASLISQILLKFIDAAMMLKDDEKMTKLINLIVERGTLLFRSRYEHFPTLMTLLAQANEKTHGIEDIVVQKEMVEAERAEEIFNETLLQFLRPELRKGATIVQVETLNNTYNC